LLDRHVRSFIVPRPSRIFVRRSSARPSVRYPSLCLCIIPRFFKRSENKSSQSTKSWKLRICCHEPNCYVAKMLSCFFLLLDCRVAVLPFFAALPHCGPWTDCHRLFFQSCESWLFPVGLQRDIHTVISSNILE
jgi:hypothetical protein